MRRLLCTAAVVAALGAGGLLVAARSGPPEVGAGSDGMTQVVYDRAAGAVEFRIGPVDLPAAGAHDEGHRHDAHAGGVLPPVGTVRLPADVVVHGLEYDLVGPDGTVLPSSLLHHVNLIDPERRELFLPISRRVAAAGRETGRTRAPRLLLGYPLRAGQPVVVTAMLHNETGRSFDSVTLRFRLLATPAGRPWPLVHAYPMQMDVLFPTGDKSFDLPPGRTVRTYEGKPAIPGRILGMSGHVHTHATRLRFEDVTAGRVIWEAAPKTAPDGTVTGVPVGWFWQRLGVRLDTAHVYRVSVEYVNPTADTIPEGGMGVVVGLFKPSADWPRADTADPLFRADRRHYLRLDTTSAAAVTPAGHDHGAHAH